MTDPAAQLAALRALRANVTDPAQGAALDALIASLESAEVAQQRQNIRGSAQVGIAVAGDVHGHIFLAGWRGKTAEELLHAYLQRLAQRCGTLPLQGVREQKAADDVLRISLDQVYTQLATTVRAERERFEGETLKAFDAKAFLEEHTGARLLPGQQRRGLHRPPTPDEQDTRHDQVQGALGARFTVEGVFAAGEIDQPLDQLSAEALGKLAGTVEWLAFAGPQLVTEAIAVQQRLVLLGEPGSGKSTALRYLALTLAEAGLDNTFDLTERLAGWAALGAHGRLLPIIVPLLPLARRLATQPGHAAGAEDLWNYLAEHLEPKGTNAGLAAAVHDELEAGRVLLLLDGLDEVAGAESRRQVVDAVRAFAEQYTSCRIVVACRVRAYEGEQNTAWRLHSWPTATLADWTVGQMEHFVAAWYTAAAAASELPDARRDERIAALQRAITARDDLKRLGVRSLLLTIMALVHLNDGRLPEDRVTLYSRCIDILLAQWEVRGKDETVYGTLMEYVGMPDADVRSLRALLEEAAFIAHEASTLGNPGRLGRATLRELVMQALADRKHPNPYDGANRFLEYTDVRAGLLQASEAGDAYVFPHQTFQEYLAGLKLVSGVGVVDRIMERRHDDRWRIPILLGIADHVSGNKLELPHLLLHKLLSSKRKSADEAQHDLLLAAEIGEDVGWDRLERGDPTFTDLRDELAQALASVVEGTVLPAAERVRGGVLLSDLGDPREGVCNLPPAMVPIIGGAFVIGLTYEQVEPVHTLWQTYWRKREQPANADDYANYFTQGESNVTEAAIELHAFAISRYPVTNAQYALFMNDGGYDPAAPWWDAAGRVWLAPDDAATEGLKDWQRRRFKNRPEWWDHERFGIARPNQPVVGISWYETIAFCKWLTQSRVYNQEGYIYTLPSEAQWEYAARGSERRVYPWGNDEPDSERANFDETHNETTAVGSFPTGATPEGVLDVAGNVWEWTRSEYCPYPYVPNDGRESLDDPAKKYFTLRGGSWFNQSINLRASNRNNNTPGDHGYNIGFRLIRHPKI